RFPLYLKEKAVDAYLNIDVNNRNEWSMLIAEFENQFKIPDSKFTKMRNFRSRLQHKNETIAEYVFELKKLVNSAYPNADCNIRKDLIVDQLFSGCREPLRIQLVNVDANSLEELMQKAAHIERRMGFNSLSIDRMPCNVKAVEQSDTHKFTNCENIQNKYSNAVGKTINDYKLNPETDYNSMCEHNSEFNFKSRMSQKPENLSQVQYQLNAGHDQDIFCSYCKRLGHNKEVCWSFNPYDSSTVKCNGVPSMNNDCTNNENLKEENRILKKSIKDLTSNIADPEVHNKRESVFKALTLDFVDDKSRDNVKLPKMWQENLKPVLNKKDSQQSIQDENKSNNVKINPIEQNEEIIMMKINIQKLEKEISWLKGKKYKVCNKRPHFNKTKCFNCFKFGHIAKYCRKRLKCSTCYKYGHISRFCKTTDNCRLYNGNNYDFEKKIATDMKTEKSKKPKSVQRKKARYKKFKQYPDDIIQAENFILDNSNTANIPIIVEPQTNVDTPTEQLITEDVIPLMDKKMIADSPDDSPLEKPDINVVRMTNNLE
ncbi:MAG TPA: hypothetical protein DDZ39_09625, partial [Flavobacteriaceae bacterium]|nr:hypothetical protein [Flavobacteriaceae bacterium]